MRIRQAPQPLIWLARMLTSSATRSGSAPLAARPAEMTCGRMVMRVSWAKGLSRASITFSLVAVIPV